MSLAKKYAIASAAVIGLAMFLLGAWVDSQIRQHVVASAARATALYMDSLIEPLIQNFDETGTLSPGSTKALEDLLNGTALGRGVIAIKLWSRDGTVIYSNTPGLTGQKFTDNDAVAAAFRGEVVAEFDDLSAPENTGERRYGVPLYEIYSPLHRIGTDRIIVVAEFYENAERLGADLIQIRNRTWAVTGLTTLAMFATLFGLVHQGSAKIDEQQLALMQRIAEQQRLAGVNRELHDRIEQAHRRSAELNEHFMRRIGADLHDGPAQMLSYALLRLDDLAPLAARGDGESGGTASLESIRSAVSNALTELRNTSAGLGLPELERLSPAEALSLAVRNHEQMTGSEVDSHFEGLPVHLDQSRMTCLYRFAQEALNNAFRHAGGEGQTLNARVTGSDLVVEVTDSGPGFATADAEQKSGRFGLVGLRYRIEALGGSLGLQSAPGSGTRLTMRLPVMPVGELRD